LSLPTIPLSGLATLKLLGFFVKFEVYTEPGEVALCTLKIFSINSKNFVDFVFVIPRFLNLKIAFLQALFPN